ncbi:MAG TPA: hypothetical protein VGN17_06540 [Bryobacteraceae bacterium]|jgi:hypothetical protein
MPNGTEAAGESIVEKRLGRWDLAAFLTLLTFITTLSYEAGYVSYWGLPFEVVQFTPENAFRVFLTLLIVGLYLGVAVMTAVGTKWYRALMRIVVPVIALALMVWIGTHYGFLADLLFFSGLAYVVWVLQILTGAEEKVGGAKWIWDALGQTGLVLSVLLLAVPFGGVAAGMMAAGEQEEFLTLDSQPKMVVLRKYGSDCVCGTLGPDKELRLLPGFRLVELNKEDGPAIRKERLGRIAPAEAR